MQELSSEKEQDAYRTVVVVRRFGEAISPVDVLVTFDDGSAITEQWDGEYRWKLYTYTRSSRALSAQVDPHHVLVLDTNSTNNSKTLAPRTPAAATKWSLKWMVWLQDALLSWAFLI